MATVLHGSVLAQRYGLNRTTVKKRRSRAMTADAPMRPSQPKSTVLTAAEEAVVVEFRRRTLLVDDVRGCLHQSIPKLTRSSQRDQNHREGKVCADRNRLRAHRHCRVAPSPGQDQYVPGH